MTDHEFYVVELMAESYHHEPDSANEHTLGVPIVVGPFDSRDRAIDAADSQVAQSVDGYAVVSIPEDEVPDEEGSYVI